MACFCGDGNGAVWAAPGFGQSVSFVSDWEQEFGDRGESFVVQFQPPSPPSPPSSPPGTFTDKESLKTAVQAYNTNPTAAIYIAMYGPIANWDVSAITNMRELFYDLQNFNADISNWDTSKVTDMQQMFHVRSARALPPPQP